MNRFRYERAPDIQNALQQGAAPGSAFVGGGTNLFDMMKLGIAQPDIVIDLNHAGLRYIQSTAGGGLLIGALATMADVAMFPLVQSNFPLLHQALVAGATPQLRNAATFGGNLLQRPRCFFFRERDFPCNKKIPGSGCHALFAADHSHAIFGGGQTCIAVHPSDLAVALVSLDAKIEIHNRRQAREVSLDELFVGAEPDPTRETVLEAGELIAAVEIPSSPRLRTAHYFKVPPAGGFANVSAAVSLEMDEGIVRSSRIVMGGVAHTPWRAHLAEAKLVGRPASARTWTEAATAEMSKAYGRGGNDFKIALGRTVLVRALEAAARVTP